MCGCKTNRWSNHFTPKSYLPIMGQWRSRSKHFCLPRVSPTRHYPLSIHHPVYVRERHHMVEKVQEPCSWKPLPPACAVPVWGLRHGPHVFEQLPETIQSLLVSQGVGIRKQLELLGPLTRMRWQLPPPFSFHRMGVIDAPTPLLTFCAPRATGRRSPHTPDPTAGSLSSLPPWYKPTRSEMPIPRSIPQGL